MKTRVVVAMSGGVDSSVAAALLKRQGYEVIGITICFNLADSSRRRPACCGREGIADARRVAHKLEIKHYVLNMQKVLEEWVIKNFCDEYSRGRTPNPCILCNQYVKFGALLKKTLSLDAKFLATGHYSCIAKTDRGYLLKKARDLNKDQSYFLYRLTQKQLRHILFPLGNYTKEEVRKLAKAWGLSVADKLASQEICFLPQDDYREFIKMRGTPEIKPGAVLDKEGNVLGRHKGIAFYTIGQREGLGIARGYPLYVIKIDPKTNQITVGKKEDAYAKEFLIKKTHFILRSIKKKIAAKVKIRYNHQERLADLIPINNKINPVRDTANLSNNTIVSNGVKVRFRKPQFAVTPGQSAVFYNNDNVLGGGVIDQVLS